MGPYKNRKLNDDNHGVCGCFIDMQNHAKSVQNAAHVRFLIVGIVNFKILKISAKAKGSPFGKICT